MDSYLVHTFPTLSGPYQAQQVAHGSPRPQNQGIVIWDPNGGLGTAGWTHGVQEGADAASGGSQPHVLPCTLFDPAIPVDSPPSPALLALSFRVHLECLLSVWGPKMRARVRWRRVKSRCALKLGFARLAKAMAGHRGPRGIPQQHRGTLLGL